MFYAERLYRTAPIIEDNRIHVTVLHFNDIYEITPVSGGKEGGIVRVATLRNQLLTRNPNTITTLDGDLFSLLRLARQNIKEIIWLDDKWLMCSIISV